MRADIDLGRDGPKPEVERPIQSPHRQARVPNDLTQPLSTHWPGEVPAAIMRQLCGVIEENSDGTAGLYKNPGRPGIAFGVRQKPPAVEVTPSALPITLAVILAMAFTVAILAWNGYCLDVVRRCGRYQ
jgi:hypothetical protein